MSQQLYDLVMSELPKIPGQRKTTPRHSFILCPFHSEKTPSGRVLHINDGIGVGSFKCMGCGRRAKWNEIAEIFGLKKFGRADSLKASQDVPPTNLNMLDDQLLSKKVNKREEVRLFELTHEAAIQAAGIRVNKWRTFKLQFLSRVGVQLAYVRKFDPETRELSDWGRYYMHLPIIIRGKQRGYIKAQIDKPKDKAVPSYINSHGSWSLKYGLFPYDYTVQLMKEKGLSTVILVEGPRDALRLLKYGLPALCIMGTQSWGSSKLRLLEFTGATRIILMMDGDTAGRKATRMITTGLDSNGNRVSPPLSTSFFVKTVRLWYADEPGLDPGNCPLDILRSVRKLLV